MKAILIDFIWHVIAIWIFLIILGLLYPPMLEAAIPSDMSGWAFTITVILILSAWLKVGEIVLEKMKLI